MCTGILYQICIHKTFFCDFFCFLWRYYTPMLVIMPRKQNHKIKCKLLNSKNAKFANLEIDKLHLLTIN